MEGQRLICDIDQEEAFLSWLVRGDQRTLLPSVRCLPGMAMQDGVCYLPNISDLGVLRVPPTEGQL